MSLDALRGFDMFWIIGADSLVHALNHLSRSGPTQFLTTQLDHAEWAGFRFYDLIFPLFVFIMGVSTVYSLTKIIEREGRTVAVKRVIVRGVLLFLIGIIYSGGVTNRWPDIRLMGVLNRIALCYVAGGLLYCWFKTRVLIGIAAGILIGYWAMLNFIPIRDMQLEKDSLAALAEKSGDAKLAAEFKAINPWTKNPSAIKDSPVWAATQRMYAETTNHITGRFEPGYNLTCHFDFEHLPARKYDAFWDPEGLLSTIPAVVTGLLGIFAGLFLRGQSVSDRRKVLWLIGAGAAGVVLGFLWGAQFPVIKKIWTSSYVLVAGGYSSMLLGVFYLIVDVWRFQGWCQPFVWMGMNPITIYLADNFLGGFARLAGRLVGGDVKFFFDTHIAKGFGELLVSLVGLLLAFWLVRFLHRNKVFLRL